LGDEAKTLEGDARTQKFAEAYEKYAAALEIKPDMHEALNNWGNRLASEAEGMDEPQRAGCMRKVGELLERARDISGKANYNFACWLALSGASNKALDELEACHGEGSLPEPAFLKGDTDLDGLRTMQRFKDLIIA
jgi:hypothetical protein